VGSARQATDTSWSGSRALSLQRTGAPCPNNGQCWSGYGNEICRMSTFQPGTGETLLDSLVPALLTKLISSYATCLGPSWDFITVPHFLELLVRTTITSILFTWPLENTSVCYQPPQRSSFRIKLAFRNFARPGLGVEDHQELVLGQLVLPEPNKAKSDDPAPLPRQHSLTMLALEPAPPLLADLGPALEPESPAALGAPGYLHSAPGPAPGEGPPPGTLLESQSAPESPCPCPVKNQPPEELPDITTFPPRLLAEQLTLMDAELFKKVVLYECLGCIWGQQKKKQNEHVAPTVRATIAHFSRLTNCVTTSCLGDHSMRACDRARVVEHWIKVARECLSLNNFSSVHAIVSALCSNPIHRLHKTWAAVTSKSTKYLKELCEKDTAVKRDLLIKAGSFKMATQERNPQRAQMRLWRQKKGVVPFLGDFLTVLQRLDSAIPDDVDGNTNKRRKEVRVLQEMQLLQVAAMNYRLQPLEKFVTYFPRMEQFSDKESYKLSCQLEPESQ
uniref:Ras-GEF domain-containing protein n=1 Tax=Mandrillus leucophaeus TaxID=9568 RepID=A0A2K5ZBH1_MANLE